MSFFSERPWTEDHASIFLGLRTPLQCIYYEQLVYSTFSQYFIKTYTSFLDNFYSLFTVDSPSTTNKIGNFLVLEAHSASFWLVLGAHSATFWLVVDFCQLDFRVSEGGFLQLSSSALLRFNSRRGDTITDFCPDIYFPHKYLAC
jgi:hypothetical protein